MQKGVHSESHVPRYGRELAPAINGSGCRGVPGLVPQPLCMKFKSAFYSKLFPVDYNRPIGLSRVPFRNIWLRQQNVYRDQGIIHLTC